MKWQSGPGGGEEKCTKNWLSLLKRRNVSLFMAKVMAVNVIVLGHN